MPKEVVFTWRMMWSPKGTCQMMNSLVKVPQGMQKKLGTKFAREWNLRRSWICSWEIILWKNFPKEVTKGVILKEVVQRFLRNNLGDNFPQGNNWGIKSKEEMKIFPINNPENKSGNEIQGNNSCSKKLIPLINFPIEIIGEQRR
jgi:hypothetical protein